MLGALPGGGSDRLEIEKQKEDDEKKEKEEDREDEKEKGTLKKGGEQQ